MTAAAFVGQYRNAPLFVLIGSVAPAESPNASATVVVLDAIGCQLLYAIAGSSERLL